MDILILGAAGMTGHLASIYLRENKHNVVGFTKHPITYCENIIGDALDKDVIKKTLHDRTYDVVVNCIGILNSEVDKNLSNGIYLNSYFPHYLVECLSFTKTKLIHLSTDCVFSGRKGNYAENDFTDAESFYGRSKALGEIKDSKNLTIRTSIIGPDRKENGIGLLNWFLKQEQEINGFSKVEWTGVSTITLIKAIEKAIEHDICGLYHLVNNEHINKYELLRLFNNYMKENKLDIKEYEGYVSNKSLVNTRRDFNYEVPSYDIMVKEMQDWIQSHKELYPHYYRG